MKNDKKAVVSIVLSCVAFLTCWICIGVPIAVVALVLAILSMKDKNSKSALRVVALISSIAALLLSTIVAVAMTGMIISSEPVENNTAENNTIETVISSEETVVSSEEQASESIGEITSKDTSEDASENAETTTEETEMYETSLAETEAQEKPEVRKEIIDGFTYSARQGELEMYAVIVIDEGVASIEGWAYLDGEDYPELDVKTYLYPNEDGGFTSEDGMYSLYDVGDHMIVLSYQEDDVLFEGDFFLMSGDPVEYNQGFVTTEEFLEFVRDDGNVGHTVTFIAEYSGLHIGIHQFYVSDGRTSVTVNISSKSTDASFFRGDIVRITGEFLGRNSNTGQLEFSNISMERQ